MIKVIPHRGMRQIGGVCTEITTEKTRLLFDFGSPLDGEGNNDVLEIEGVTRGETNCDAIFLTHYHGDHVGEISRIMADIPVYMQKTARRILEAQQKHKVSVGQKVWANEVIELTEGVPVTIKDLKVTPLASDHSAIDSLMYLVEGYNKRILITGDYRLHGFHEEQVKETLKNMEHIDLMITEGTNISRTSSYYHDEHWVENEFTRIFKKYKYVFLLTSSSNVDRIAAFSRQVPYGRHALADKYQTKVMKIADKYREEDLKSHKLWPYQLEKQALYEQRGFGMVIRAGGWFTPLIRDFFEKYPEQTCLIYSMWSGYEKLHDVSEIIDIAKNHFERVHVSGHITKEDLEKVLNIVRPDKLIIHHTSVKYDEERALTIPDDTVLLPIEDSVIVEL